MDNDIVRFISSLNSGSWLRLLLTVVLTTASVLMAYGIEIGYKLLIGCNLVTISGTVYLEYRRQA